MTSTLPITADTARRRTEIFRDSLNKSFSSERISELDMWTDLGGKVIQLGLASLTILAAVPLLETYVITPSLVSAIVGLFATLVFEVGYKYAIIRKMIDARIQMVTFSIYLLWYGLIFASVVIIRPYLDFGFVTTALLAGTFATLAFVSTKVLRKRVYYFLINRLAGSISDEMLRFAPIIAALSLRFESKSRSTGQSFGGLLVLCVIILASPFQQSLNPIIWLIPVILSIFILWGFFRFNTFADSLNLLWDWGEQKVTVDLMTFSFYLRNRLESLGIEEYEVNFSWKSCIRQEDIEKQFALDQIICAFMFAPDGFEDVIVLTLANTKPDLRKIQRLLGEKWGPKSLVEKNTGKMLKSSEVILGVLPPFGEVKGRILIDNSILKRKTVAWVSGKPCFGVVFESNELLKLSQLTGDFSA